MKRTLLGFLIIMIAAGIMVAIALYVPNSLPVNSDFSALYNTDLALANGIPIYDLPAVNHCRSLASSENFSGSFPVSAVVCMSTFIWISRRPQRLCGSSSIS
jgi:hypothetical protein